MRRNIRWIRDARNISAAELSATLSRLERPIPVLGVQRIEAGTRRVDVDDLVTIAVALGVSPASLLMPMYEDDAVSQRTPVPARGAEIRKDSLVPISAWNRPVSARVVWDWLSAAAPLVRGTLATFMAHGLPGWERERMEAEVAEVRRRVHEQVQAELTGETRERKRTSEVAAEVRADAALGSQGSDDVFDQLEAQLMGEAGGESGGDD